MTPEFGERLRAARVECGLSQEQLAEDAGLHQTHIGLLERAKREPSLDTLTLLGRALDVSPADMILWHKPRDPHTPQ
jgi:transcriptional regulator with XRE-family HTH domain